MEVVVVDIDTFGNAQPKPGKSLGGQAVGFFEAEIGPSHPIDVVGKGKVGHGVQARSDAGAAAGRGAIGMRVSGVEGGVRIEVFLHVDDVVGNDFGADIRRVEWRIAAGKTAILQNLRKTIYVVGKNGERTASLAVPGRCRESCHGCKNGCEYQFLACISECTHVDSISTPSGGGR